MRAYSAGHSGSGEGDVQKLAARLIVLEAISDDPKGEGRHSNSP